MILHQLKPQACRVRATSGRSRARASPLNQECKRSKSRILAGAADRALSRRAKEANSQTRQPIRQAKAPAVRASTEATACTRGHEGGTKRRTIKIPKPRPCHQQHSVAPAAGRKPSARASQPSTHGKQCQGPSRAIQRGSDSLHRMQTAPP